MKRNAIETIMGAFVLVLAVGFLAFAYQMSDIHKGGSDGYKVLADFSNVTGVGKGSDVRIGGIKIGVIQDMGLAPNSYQARLTLGIDKDIKLPTDTSAAITSEGLLGSKFVSLQPGGDTQMVKNGDKLEFTQSSVSLEDLIGKFAFSGGGVDSSAAKTAAAADPATSAKPAAKGAGDTLSMP